MCQTEKQLGDGERDMGKIDGKLARVMIDAKEMQKQGDLEEESERKGEIRLEAKSRSRCKV